MNVSKSFCIRGLTRVIPRVHRCHACQRKFWHRETRVVIQRALGGSEHLKSRRQTLLKLGTFLSALLPSSNPFIYNFSGLTFPFFIQTTWSGMWITWSTTHVNITWLPTCTCKSPRGKMDTRGVTTTKSISFLNLKTMSHYSLLCDGSPDLLTELTWHWYEPSSAALTSLIPRVHTSPVWRMMNLGSGMKTSVSTARMCLSRLLTQDTDLLVTSSTPHSRNAVVPAWRGWELLMMMCCNQVYGI